jgi:hypothetical protein
VVVVVTMMMLVVQRWLWGAERVDVRMWAEGHERQRWRLVGRSQCDGGPLLLLLLLLVLVLVLVLVLLPLLLLATLLLRPMKRRAAATFAAAAGGGQREGQREGRDLPLEGGCRRGGIKERALGRHMHGARQRWDGERCHASQA